MLDAPAAPVLGHKAWAGKVDETSPEIDVACGRSLLIVFGEGTAMQIRQVAALFAPRLCR